MQLQAMLEGSCSMIFLFISLDPTLANKIDLRSFAITFATVKRRLGSTGTLYLTIINNPRVIRR
jgi:hypothetical protein